MSFLGPKLLLKIDSQLREAFPHQQYVHFSGVLVILFSDLAQLPLFMEKPIYTSHSSAKLIWEQFTIVVTIINFYHYAKNG